MITKMCKLCNKEKDINDFYDSIMSEDGKRHYCKDCTGIIPQPKIKKYQKTKLCSKCGKRKQLNKFHNNKLTRDGKNVYCKECLKPSLKSYLQSNKGKIALSKCQAKRKRNMGFIPLNTIQPNHDGHHIDNDYVIYIPHDIHNSIYHNHNDVESMVIINQLALEYLATCEHTKAYKSWQSLQISYNNV